MRKELDDGVVGPVKVFDYQDQGAPGCERLKEPQPGRKQFGALGGRGR